MMSTITFDTLKFVERLEKSGVPREQAAAMAEAFKDASGEADLVTKQDLRELEYRMTIKLGGLMVAAVGIVAALVKML